MKNLLRLSGLFSALLLGSCCANDTCNCDDLLQDAVYFKPGPQYTAADIDTIYIRRYATVDTTLTASSTTPTTAPDTLRVLTQASIVRAQFRKTSFITQLLAHRVDTARVVPLTNTYPFSPLTTGGNIGKYRYRIFFIKGNARAKTASDTFQFTVRHIIIKGQYQADGCCTCYQNTYKKLTLNGKQYNVTERDNSNPPRVLQLGN